MYCNVNIRGGRNNCGWVYHGGLPRRNSSGRDKVPPTLDTDPKWLGDIVAEVSAKAQGEEDLLFASCAKYLCQRCLATG